MPVERAGIDVTKAREAELDAAYAELHKLWFGINVVFDRDVYNRVAAWWDAKQKEEADGD